MTSLKYAIMDFGNHIRELREAQNLLLRELAASLDMDVAYLSKIERGNRAARKEQVIAFAQALKNCFEFVERDINKLIIEELKLVNFVND